MMLVIYVIIFVIGIFLTMCFYDSWKRDKEYWDLFLFLFWTITDVMMFICILKIIFGL